MAGGGGHGASSHRTPPPSLCLWVPPGSGPCARSWRVLAGPLRHPPRRVTQRPVPRPAGCSRPRPSRDRASCGCVGGGASLARGLGRCRGAPDITLGGGATKAVGVIVAVGEGPLNQSPIERGASLRAVAGVDPLGGAVAGPLRAHRSRAPPTRPSSADTPLGPSGRVSAQRS